MMSWKALYSRRYRKLTRVELGGSPSAAGAIVQACCYFGVRLTESSDHRDFQGALVGFYMHPVAIPSLRVRPRRTSDRPPAHSHSRFHWGWGIAPQSLVDDSTKHDQSCLLATFHLSSVLRTQCHGVRSVSSLSPPSRTVKEGKRTLPKSTQGCVGYSNSERMRVALNEPQGRQEFASRTHLSWAASRRNPG